MCQTLHYCSQPCQALDWHQGGHRQTCENFVKFRHGTLNQISTSAATLTSCVVVIDEHLSSRDRSFLRALLAADYGKNEQDILRHQITWMTRYPGRQFYTVFSYIGGRCTVQMTGVDRIDSEDDTLKRHWRDFVSRETKSGGRMQLYVMEVAMGTGTRKKIIPLRSSSSAIFDGLKHIANELTARGTVDDGPIAGEILWRIQALMRLKVQRIHC
ncbi:hypothetical protein B0H10DRAFT_292525 [Mycena sp. CBHHK59/15]|nr:hypothetical protein B0H10DRAFT_292525 [Mycena sp. CBHHK59/15]